MSGAAVVTDKVAAAASFYYHPRFMATQEVIAYGTQAANAPLEQVRIPRRKVLAPDV